MSEQTWTRQELIDLCIAVEAVCVPFGCHVAMTGGCLYKPGNREDADILFYRIRQRPTIDVDGLFGALHLLGFVRLSGFAWCWQFTFEGKAVDIFFPEQDKITTTIPMPENIDKSKAAKYK